VLVVVGDVDPDEAMSEIAARYGVLPAGTPDRIPGPAEEGIPGFRHREWTGDIGQTQIAMGWRTPPTLDDATPGLDLLATILGTGRASRLYRAVREQKLASSVSAYDYTPTSLGVFVIHAESPPERAAEAARAIWAQVRDIREHGVSEGELVRAKRVYEARWVRRLEDMEGQANYLAEWEALGEWAMGDEYLRRALTVTTDEIQALAHRFLDPDRAGVIVYRPKASTEIASDAASMRALLDDAPVARVEPTVVSPLVVPAIVSGLRAEREEGGVHVFRTEAGIPVLVRRKSGALVHAGVYLLGGGRDEPVEHAGLTSLLVRSALKGTTTRSALQIAEEAERLGGTVTGSPGVESFGWMINVPARHAPQAIELLADVTQHAVIPGDALETERAIALADLVALRDDMYRYPVRLATQAAFAGHPYGVPPTGDERTLPTITAAMLREWHRARVLQAPAVIALVGDAEPAELAALAAGAFGELRGGDVSPLQSPGWPSGVVQRIEQREKAQTALALMFPGPSRRDEARFATAMIAGVASGLGGRFFDELRDKQSLGYTVHAFASERAVAGSFVAYIATSPEKEDVARRGLLTEFAKLRDEPVTTKELDQARTYAIGVHAIRQQSGGAVLGEVVDAFLFGRLAELDEFDARVRAVSAEQMRQVARAYFDEDVRVEGMIRGR
jgi:zinc protease